jgi:hypothetical protein
MAPVTLRDRFRYRIDTFMSRGPGVLIVGLFAAGDGIIVLVEGD